MYDRVSILVPVFNNAETLRDLVTAVSREAALASRDIQFVFVEDCSQDRSREVLREMRCDGVHVVENTENIGQQASIFRGLAACDGQAVVVMDADLQDPPEAVPDLLKALHGGAHDVVFATRVGAYQSRRRMLFSRWFRFLVRRLTNLPVGAGGFLAMTSDVARTLRQKKSPRFYLTGLIGCGGYRITSIPVRRNHRPGGASSYSGRMRLSLGLTNLSVILQERFLRGQR